MSNKSTGLKTIAYELGISINTVSRALRDCNDVSQATKELVRKKATELGYMPNNISQFLKRDERKLVAVIIDNLSNLFFIVMTNKLLPLIRERDMDYTIIVNDSELVGVNAIKQCISQRVDIIVSLNSLEDEAIETARRHDIPIIAWGLEENRAVDTLTYDYCTGLSLAANYLANRHKLNDIYYVGIEGSQTSSNRYNLFQSFAKAINASIDVAKLDVATAVPDIIEAIQNKPIGVFCFNDEVCFRFLDDLNKVFPNFRKIYPKFHMISFDGIRQCIHGLNDVTTVCFDYDAISKCFIDLIERRLANPKGAKEQYVFGVGLHVRGAAQNPSFLPVKKTKKQSADPSSNASPKENTVARKVPVANED